jgi:hypothetical protein
MRRVLLASALICAFAVPALAECRCLYRGGEAKQGETACITTANGPSLARCEMVLNNSSWTVLNTPCDIKQSSRNTPPNAPS